MEMAMGYFKKGCKMKYLVNVLLLSVLLNGSVFAKECIMNQLNKYDNKKSINLQEVKKRYFNNNQLYRDFYGNKVEEMKRPSGEFFVDIKIPNTPYLVSKRYNASGKLYYFEKKIKGMNIGNLKTYDKVNNKIIHIINTDQDFEFELCDLIKLMNKKYDRNIEDDKIIFSIERWYDTEKYNKLIYEVVVRNPDYTLTEYIIDGKSGETLNISPRTEYLN